MNFRLERVQYMPAELAPGVLYFAEEFGAAAHLCPCGCKHKVHTPIGPTDWSLRMDSKGPTLDPSVGNWQQPCKAHYLIRNGAVAWAGQWTPQQIAAGRARERARDLAFFDQRARERGGVWARFVRWLKRLFGIGE